MTAPTAPEVEIPLSAEFPGLTVDQADTFLRVCSSMAEGELVSRLIARNKLTWRSLYAMVETSDATREWYARARLFQAHQIAEDVLNIADGTDELGKLYDDLIDLAAEEISPEHRQSWLNSMHHGRVQRDKLRADKRQWYASKLAPKLFGDKLDITSNGETVQSGVVLLPTRDGPLEPPAEGAVIEQTTRIAVSSKGHETSQVMKHLLGEFKQGRLPLSAQGTDVTEVEEPVGDQDEASEPHQGNGDGHE